MEQIQTPLQSCHPLAATGMPSLDAVRALEQELAPLPQVVIEPAHLVHGGMYARTILIPAGTVLTGVMTNTDNVCIVCGDITVTTDEGPRRLTGYHVLPADKGAKRVGMTHADTYWTAIWKTDLHDIAAIEDEMSGESHLLQTRAPALSQPKTARVIE